MRKLLYVPAVGVVLAWCSLSGAQAPPKPGPEHEKLKQMEGVWDATIQSKEGESKGTMNYKMGLGGLWLMEHFKGEFGDAKFEGVGVTGYDSAKKKYVAVWIDSHSSSPMLSEGNLDKDGKTMTMIGEMSHDGKAMKVKMVTEMIDANSMVFTLTSPGPDGKDMQMLKISYKRKAK
jgi:hypothetical protein